MVSSKKIIGLAEATCNIVVRTSRDHRIHIRVGETCKIIRKEIYRRTLVRYTFEYKDIAFVATEGYRLNHFKIKMFFLDMSCLERLRRIFL